MVKFGGKIGTLYQMLKNAFKKHPLQNRTNVQIKGGGGQRPFEQCSKKLHFFERGASLSLEIDLPKLACRVGRDSPAQIDLDIFSTRKKLPKMHAGGGGILIWAVS